MVEDKKNCDIDGALLLPVEFLCFAKYCFRGSRQSIFSDRINLYPSASNSCDSMMKELPVKITNTDVLQQIYEIQVYKKYSSSVTNLKLNQSLVSLTCDWPSFSCRVTEEASTSIFRWICRIFYSVSQLSIHVRTLLTHYITNNWTISILLCDLDTVIYVRLNTILIRRWCIRGNCRVVMISSNIFRKFISMLFIKISRAALIFFLPVIATILALMKGY